jgi:hypothetical protein
MINGDLKPFGVHEIKFNDAQFFLSKEGKEKGKSSEPVKTLRNVAPTEGSKYDASSEEGEEIKFHFKPQTTLQTKRSNERSDEEVIFNLKSKIISQIGFSSNDSDEEVTFNLKNKTASQVETSSNEESEESEDSGHTMSRNIPVYGS